jgi:hypothetical protein
VSVRDDPVLFLQPGKKATGGSVLGGNAIATTKAHRLDGPEHTAAEDTTRLDASTERHGLMPKLSGDASDVLLGDGTWGTAAAGAMVPYYIAVGDTFTVPLYRQALFSEPIEVDGALVVNGLLIGVD